MSEIWVPVFGYEETYEVSSMGNIRSCTRVVEHTNRWGTTNAQTRKARPMKASTQSHGYERISLNLLGHGKSLLVHRIVVESFLRPLLPGEQVNHIDGNKKNNSIPNLEICSPQENSMHSVITGLYPSGDRNGSRTMPKSRPTGERNTQSKLTELDVRRIRAMRAEGLSLTKIASFFPVNFRSIHNVVKGKTWNGVK